MGINGNEILFQILGYWILQENSDPMPRKCM